MARAADADRFDELAAAHAAAFTRSPPDLCADVVWGGLIVRVQIAGRSLARIFHRAVAHLVQPARASAPPDLSVYLSEPRDTAPLRLLHEIGSGLPRVWTAPAFEVRSSACGRLVGVAFAPRSRYVLDREARVLAGVQDPARLQLFERTKPLMLPMRVVLQDRGIHLVHAGAVVTDDGGVLIAGPKGAGKSSTALRCFMAGGGLLGDDQVALVGSGADVVGHSLYSAAHLEAHWLPRIGAFPSAAVEYDAVEDKVGIFLPEIAPERLHRSVPIRAVVLPRPAPQRPTAIAPASRAEALMRIAPSSLFLPLGAGRDGVRRLRDLVQHVPAYWLDAGEDASSIPAAVREAARRSGRR